jgi:hypothetical protein
MQFMMVLVICERKVRVILREVGKGRREGGGVGGS